MIKFKKVMCLNVYGGCGYMDNSHEIYANDSKIGIMHYPNAGNSEIALKPGEMFLEYIKLDERGHARNVLSSIFTEFEVSCLYGESGDENKSFWEKMGASIGKDYKDEFREMYDFVLSRDSFYEAQRDRTLSVTVYDDFMGLELTGEFSSINEAREYYALELDTNKDDITILRIEFREA